MTDKLITPPHDEEIERRVLGVMLLYKGDTESGIELLKPDYFYNRKHEIIFSAMQNLYSDGIHIDLATVANRVKKMGQFEYIGGLFGLTEITDKVISINMNDYCDILKQFYIRRTLINVSNENIKNSYDETIDVKSLINNTQDTLYSLVETGKSKETLSMKELCATLPQDINRVNNGKLKGIPTGILALDNITNGFQGSDLIILAARPAMGKSALSLTYALSAVNHGVPVLIFSFEMGATQFRDRIVSNYANVYTGSFNSGKFSEYEKEKINKNLHKLENLPIFIEDNPSLTVNDIRVKVKRFKQKHNVGLVIVDYIQLINYESGGNRTNREGEVSHISRRLKLIAKENNIPVIALSQLSRAVESRPDKRPILSDLRESGSIEQDSDVVMFIYRPEYYDIQQDHEGNSTHKLAEIMIAKHRNGELGTVRSEFNGAFMRFSDWNSMSSLKEEQFTPIKSTEEPIF